MNKTARMSGNERAELFAETADRKGVSDAIIEKDFWVCWALKQLFSIEALSGRLLFKGGTSLSKIFHAINRFSEDIDLAVDYAALGFTGVRDPRQEAISKSKRTGILEQMMAECQRYIGGEFLDALRVRCEEVLGTEGAWGLDVDEIRQDEIEDGTKKLGRVIASLNRCYWEHSSETLNATLVGSWAKQTRVRPFSDIDIMFVLPWNVYWRFEKRIGNKQSQLLQELRTNLRGTYPRTDIRGDGQVVIVTVDGVTIEVVPAFRFDDGRLMICDTNDDGKYKWADPAAELQALEKADAAYNKNARQLTRLLKKWQIQKDVPIKAFQLERLAIEFLEGWQNSARDRFWYDWMMRDFFLFMIGRANGFIQMPGTGEWVCLGSEWHSAAKVAYTDAFAACVYEQANLEVKAGNSWKEIFGSAAPVTVA